MDATADILSAAVKIQQELGWQNFIKGRIAKEWCLAQSQYCKDRRNTNHFNAIQWSTKCIKAI
eukprot:12590208-Ditylum_brightwellii.AAC.1